MGCAQEHREAVVSSLHAFRLMEFDWDGSGGLPIRADVCDTAHDLFNFAEGDILPNDILSRIGHPSISMSSNGTVEFVYGEAETDRQLFLTFQCHDVVTYVKIFEDEQTTIEGTIRLGLGGDYCEAADFDEIRDLFYWLAEE